MIVFHRPSPLGSGLMALTLGVWLARDVAAHIDLRQPAPREVGSSREPNSDLKQGPCGQLVNGRTAEASVFAPGETIEVSWTETINHRSYYRVAFDRDGDDAFPTFPGSGRGTQDIDPRLACPVDGQVILAYELEDGARGEHTLRVTLPDVECERCTLQLVQYMFDANNPYYFQCADLALRRPAPGDAGPAARALDAGALDASTSVEPRAAPGCWERIAPLDAGRSAPNGNDGVESDTPAADSPSATAPPSVERAPADPPRVAAPSAPAATGSDGCALGVAGAGHRAPGWLALALVAAACGARARRPLRRGASRRLDT